MRAGGLSPIIFSFCVISCVLASSSTCSFTNHWRKTPVALSFSDFASSTIRSIDSVTFCSCLYASENTLSGDSHFDGEHPYAERQPCPFSQGCNCRFSSHASFLH